MYLDLNYIHEEMNNVLKTEYIHCLQFVLDVYRIPISCIQYRSKY
jgi:hypothetical protein